MSLCICKYTVYKERGSDHKVLKYALTNVYTIICSVYNIVFSQPLKLAGTHNKKGCVPLATRNYLNPLPILRATADTYMNDDSFIQKTLFFSRHDEVVCVVFVVHNVLQVNA